MRPWSLPEGIEDILPPEAARLEAARRTLLDLFAVHGYELVMPPLIEFLDSLLTGSARDMALDTFTLVDQLSGRPMGVRADITPQTARIDAHLLNRPGVTRLCYAGSVLHTRPGALGAGRELFQVGAEIFGHAGLEADVEIQRLMLAALARLGIDEVYLDLGHVGIFRALAARAGVDADREAELFQLLQAKDVPGLAECAAAMEPSLRRALLALPGLYGGHEVLERAARVLPQDAEIGRALDALATLAEELSGSGVTVRFDLAELRGYHYHSGVVFAAYCRGHARAVAQGGRYDGAGRIFGRSRPATGFSLDLRQLMPLLREEVRSGAVLAPYGRDPGLLEAIARLRAAGEVVWVTLPGDVPPERCDRVLVARDGAWRVEPLDTGSAQSS